MKNHIKSEYLNNKIINEKVKFIYFYFQIYSHAIIKNQMFNIDF